MKKTIRINNLILCLCIVVGTFISCTQTSFNKDMKLNKNEALFQQYAFLLKRSFDYTDNHKKLLPSIQKFIDTCKEYDFYLNTRLNPVILQPILFNNNKSKMIIMVLTREYEGQHEPAEYIHFLFGRKIGNKWEYSLKSGYQRSFSYMNNYPLLSDQEMTIRVLRNIIDFGYMELYGYKINDSFFDNDDW